MTLYSTAQYGFISLAGVLSIGERIMRTNTFDDIDRLFDRMNRFAGLEDGSWSDRMDGIGSSGMRLDLAEHDDEFVVVADLPGFATEEIDLSVDGDRLHISASHDTESDEQDENYVHQERARRSVTRSLSLPAAIDSEMASATYTNGVLTVTLPKQSGESGQRIDIE